MLFRNLSPNAVSLDASRFRVQRRRLWKVLRPRRVYAAGSEYSPKLVRILPSRAPEQAGKRVSSTPLPVAHLGSSNPLRFHSLPLSRAWGRGYSKAPPQRERRGSGVPEQAGPLRLARAPRRGQSAAGEARPLPGGKARQSAALAGPSVPHRVARRSGAAAASAGLAPSSPSACGAPAAEPGRSV